MAAKIRALEVERANGTVRKVVMVLETIESMPIIRYKAVFVPNPISHGKMKTAAKYFYNELGLLVDYNANVPSEIFNRMARNAAAIMFEKHQKGEDQ